MFLLGSVKLAVWHIIDQPTTIILLLTSPPLCDCQISTSCGSTGFVHSPEDKETQDMAGMEIPSFDQALVPMHEASMGIINLVLILLAVHVCARLVGGMLGMWYVMSYSL